MGQDGTCPRQVIYNMERNDIAPMCYQKLKHKSTFGKYNKDEVLAITKLQDYYYYYPTEGAIKTCPYEVCC